MLVKRVGTMIRYRILSLALFMEKMTSSAPTRSPESSAFVCDFSKVNVVSKNEVILRVAFANGMVIRQRAFGCDLVIIGQVDQTYVHVGVDDVDGTVITLDWIKRSQFGDRLGQNQRCEARLDWSLKSTASQGRERDFERRTEFSSRTSLLNAWLFREMYNGAI